MSEGETHIDTPLASINMISLSFTRLIEGQTTNSTMNKVLFPIDMLDTGIVPGDGSLIWILRKGDGHILNLGEEVDGEVSV